MGVRSFLIHVQKLVRVQQRPTEVHEGRGAGRIHAGRDLIRNRWFFVTRQPLSEKSRLSAQKLQYGIPLRRGWRPREGQPVSPFDLLVDRKSAVIQNTA